MTEKHIDCISIDPVSGLLRVDGIPICKVIMTQQGPTLQFKDNDKLRSKYRGSPYIEVALTEFDTAIIRCSS